MLKKFVFTIIGNINLLFQNDLDDPERGMIFVCSATHKTKVSFCYFFLMVVEILNISTEQGFSFTKNFGLIINIVQGCQIVSVDKKTTTKRSVNEGLPPDENEFPAF